MSVLIAGIGRSGTSTIFELLGGAYLRNDPSTECFYEPLLWSVESARKTGRVKGASFSTDDLSAFGIYTHVATPLFTDRSDEALQRWNRSVFGEPAGGSPRVVKEIRAMGRLTAILADRPDIRCVMLTRNPLDTVNSSLGMFSFFGEEFYKSDRPRFVAEIEEREGPQRWPADRDFAAWGELYVRKMTDAGLQTAKAFADRMMVMPYEVYAADKASALQNMYAFLGLGEIGDEIEHIDRAAGPVTNARNLSLLEVEALGVATERYCEQMRAHDPLGRLGGTFCDGLVAKYRAMKPQPPLLELATIRRTALQWRLSASEQTRRRGAEVATDATSSAQQETDGYYQRWISQAARDGRITVPACATTEATSQNRPHVTCVISAYNNELTLEACVASAMGQTRPFDSVLIADDHSTDSTEELSRSLMRRYERLSYHRRAVNVGPSANRDIAIRSAEGLLVTQVDADDLLHPTKNEFELSALQSPLQDVAFSNIEMLTETGTKAVVTSDYDGSCGEEAFEAIITRKWPVPRDVLMSKDLFLRAGGYEYFVSLYEDWRLKLRLCNAMSGKWRFAGGAFGTTYDRRVPGLSAGSPIKHVYWQLDAVASVVGLSTAAEPVIARACCQLVAQFPGKLDGLQDRFLARHGSDPNGVHLNEALKAFHGRIRIEPDEGHMFEAVLSFLRAASGPDEAARRGHASGDLESVGV